MKYTIIICLIFTLSACNNRKQPVNKFQNFIDVDINGDYKGYFEKLSNTYINILKIKYKTQDCTIVYDSLVNSRREIHDSIKLGVYRVKNYLVDSLVTKEKNVRILKYRLSMFDTNHQSELFQEKIIIETTEDQINKYIPYNPESLPKTDSLLTANYSPDFLKKISKTLKFTEYEENSIVFKKTKIRFVEYFSLFKGNNFELLDFIYPPILQSLLANNNQTDFTLEQKKEIVDYIKKGRDSQKLNFKRFLIDGFKKTDCRGKDAYLLDYAIDVGNNLYIPSKLIVILKNEQIYFIESDFKELKTNFTNVFSDAFIDCLKYNSEN